MKHSFSNRNKVSLHSHLNKIFEFFFLSPLSFEYLLAFLEPSSAAKELEA